MHDIIYRDRKAVRIENDFVRLTMTAESANIAEIFHIPTGVNPLWTPPWPLVEPPTWITARYPEYGTDEEARVLAAIMGHSICLDTYGTPSPEETAAGIPIHGEAFGLRYRMRGGGDAIEADGELPLVQLRCERSVRLAGDSSVAVVQFTDAVENLSASDRPIAWTQHITLGPSYLERGRTQFRIPASRSKVIDSDFGGAQLRAAEFTWPFCPAKDGTLIDLRVFPAAAPSGGFTTHLMDTAAANAHFIAWSPSSRIAFGYIWKRSDFPWLCRWEENCLRGAPPWNGRAIALGLEFGVSPFVESRRAMVDHGSLFGAPSFRWLPAKARIAARYCAFIGIAEAIPESVPWDGAGSVRFTS